MPKVQAIHSTPVKSFGLASVSAAQVSNRGILNDRRFLVLDSERRVVTQRQIGKLTQARAEYDDSSDRLSITLPNGIEAVGHPKPGERTATVLWGRVINGALAEGDWNAALSEFCGADLTLMKPDDPGACFDEYPVSLISEASIANLSDHTNGAKRFEARRFRPTLLIGGCDAHEEDDWLGKGLAVGERLRLRVVARDPRCAITTLDPDTGERDFDTLRLILGFRPSRRAAYLGVYGIVEVPGEVSVGDDIRIIR